MVTSWLIFLIVVLWATRVEGLSLSTLGLKRPTLATFGWSLVAVMATYVALGVYYRVIAPLFGGVATPSAVGEIVNQPLYEILILSLSSGVIEELVFRFYPISRLHWLTGNKWLASIIPMIVSVGLHVPKYGLEQVIPVTLGTLVFTLLYWWRRDYCCNALTHFLIDFSAFGVASLAAHHSL
jgi:membrane protease YdiL (CAAX protease family)